MGTRATLRHTLRICAIVLMESLKDTGHPVPALATEVLRRSRGVAAVLFEPRPLVSQRGQVEGLVKGE
jgi:hypothetical protein